MVFILWIKWEWRENKCGSSTLTIFLVADWAGVLLVQNFVPFRRPIGLLSAAAPAMAKKKSTARDWRWCVATCAWVCLVVVNLAEYFSLSQIRGYKHRRLSAICILSRALFAAFIPHFPGVCRKWAPHSSHQATHSMTSFPFDIRPSPAKWCCFF